MMQRKAVSVKVSARPPSPILIAFRAATSVMIVVPPSVETRTPRQTANLQRPRSCALRWIKVVSAVYGRCGLRLFGGWSVGRVGLPLVGRIAESHAGHRLDPDDMALHRLDAGHRLGRDACRVALVRLDHGAPKLHDPVSNDDID